MPTGTRTGRATRASTTSGRRPATSTSRSTSAAAPRGGSSNGARPRRRAQKWVYLFEDGDASMRDLLGGKGAGVAEMTRAGLPVPPGFTITTKACNAFYESGQKFPDGMWEQVLRALKETERKTGKKFGDPVNPLLVSVRSGAKFSMPGMMDTVLNLGLNARTLEGLAALTGDERFAKDAYRRFIQLFSKIVLGIDGDLFEHELDAVKTKARAKTDADLKPKALDEVIERYRKLVRKHAGIEFPEDPMEQLRAAIGAVFSSWNNKRATDYRNFNKIPHDLGTAVNVQSMVFGNMGDDSGTGVAFTRDPSTGRARALRRVPHQRPGRGRGRRHPHPQADQCHGQGPAQGIRTVRAHRQAAGEALPRRAGHGVHHRARPALHAADTQRQAHRRGGREDRGRHGAVSDSSPGRRRCCASSPPRSTSCCTPGSTPRPR